MERNEILSVAIDAIKGKDEKFSKKQTSDELRAAFIEMNGGSDKINLKNFYKGTPLFSLVEEMIPYIIDEAIKTSDNPLFGLVEYRNLSDGDEAEFYVEEEANFVVASVANGIRDPRRQRLMGGASVSVPTEMKIVRVYENLGRLLAGRIDFDQFVKAVAKAFTDYVTLASYTALAGITTSTEGLNATYVKSGSISEANLLTLIEHVEAATHMSATIVGSKTAVRKLGSAVTYSAEQNTDLYNMGYIGKMAGVPVVAFNQVHIPGTDTFAFADDALWIVASGDKPIKVVNVGEGLMLDKDPYANADLTKEYIYAQEIGVAFVCGAKMGFWKAIV